MTAGRQEGEAVLNRPLKLATAATEQRAIAAVEAELATVHAHEVEDRARRFVPGLPQPAAELLEEEDGAFGRAQHEQRVHGRDVYALVEQVDREDHLNAASRQIGQRLVALLI